MRSFFTFTIAVLILTACSQAVPSATSIPLPSLTPTTNTTATPTPPPTFTPLPPLPEFPTYFADMTIAGANMEIKTPEDIAKIQNIEWGDMTNRAFATWIKEQYYAGKIEPFGPDVKPLQTKQVNPRDSSFEKRGWGPAFEPLLPILSQDEMPAKGVGAFVSFDETGQKFLIIPHLWKIGDGERDLGVILYKFTWHEKYDDVEYLKKVLNNNMNLNGLVDVPARYKDKGGVSLPRKDYPRQ